MKKTTDIHEDSKKNDTPTGRALFNLGNQFKPEWVRRKGFWRLLWFAILAKFGIVTANKYADDGCYFSIGTAMPLPNFWDAGYKVSYAGQVLGEDVLFYEWVG